MVEIERSDTTAPIPPGEILREEFMAPLGLTVSKVARACDIPRNRIEMILRERLGISGDTALRLGRAFGTTAELWMNLQTRYELQTARQAIGGAIERIAPVGPSATIALAPRR